MPRMEINTRHNCEACVEFFSNDGQPGGGMFQGTHEARMNISVALWEEMGKPMAFDLAGLNVVGVDG